jgi:putative chitinase
MIYPITLDTFKKAVPLCKDPTKWLEAFNSKLPSSTINTKLRLCAFIAQCAHESSNFNILQENLNYSAKGLKVTFPKYFVTDETALMFERQPAKIANRVYADRMGNGTEMSGEGYKYRGRGIIMLTGRDNYLKLSSAIGIDNKYTVNPDLLMKPEDAIDAALWFWNKNNLNQFADKSDMITLTKRINGGLIGIDERIANYKRALVAL